MEASDYCKARNIGKTGMLTPLLVPSFSSMAFPNPSDVQLVMNQMKTHLAISSLVSAYDLHSGFLSKEITMSDIVILDSGNYERRVLEDLGCRVQWTENELAATVDSIVPLTQVAIVNYDQPGPIERQVDLALSFFASRSKHLSDFLYKPLTPNDSYIDLNEIEKNVDILLDFDIFGVTEKEPGSSLLEKCKNLTRIRKCFTLAGHNIPIHIFGCFEPLKIILLFMCGGDVFDGLTWARYAFRGNSIIYPGSIPFLDRKWSTADSTIARLSTSQSLSQITDLMFRLRLFAKGQNYHELAIGEEAMDSVKAIMERVGNESS